MSWRDHLPVHPAADLFPLMSNGELRELGENIKANGLLSPVMCVFIGGVKWLVDGRNRLDAIELVGTDRQVAFEELPDGADPYDYVLALNVYRRHP